MAVGADTDNLENEQPQKKKGKKTSVGNAPGESLILAGDRLCEIVDCDGNDKGHVRKREHDDESLMIMFHFD